MNTNTKINTTLLKEILEETPENQNIMLMGKHGIGKSQILESFFSEKGFKVVTLFLGQMSDPGDLIGIPHKNEITGHTEFLPPYWFPTDDTPVVLFLDELNRARPEVLQTIMDLALNKKLAGHSLPKGSRLISAVNNGDEYQLTELDPALVSRFNIYEFVPSVNEWLDWAEKNEIDERIRNFISKNGEMLDCDKINEDDCMEKSPDRRGWQKVSDFIKGKELNQNRKNIISGIIGKKAANCFMEFICNNERLTGEKLLLGNFDQTVQILEKTGTAEMAALNDSVFEYLEKGKISAADKYTVAQNLQKYYGYLEKKNYREILSHFANIFAGKEHPNALMFIISECENLYMQVTDYVNALGSLREDYAYESKRDYFKNYR